MTASEAAPAPWEIWHTRFNFDDRGYKFRPVLVLACSPGGLLAAMITSTTTKHSPRSPNNGVPQQFSTDTTRRNPSTGHPTSLRTHFTSSSYPIDPSAIPSMAERNSA